LFLACPKANASVDVVRQQTLCLFKKGTMTTSAGTSPGSITTGDIMRKHERRVSRSAATRDCGAKTRGIEASQRRQILSLPESVKQHTIATKKENESLIK
jgi:hypothetical protein